MNQKQKTIALIIDYIDVSLFKESSYLKDCLENIYSVISFLDIPVRLIEGKSTDEILTLSLQESKGFENILIFHSNMPFVFKELCQEIVQRHTRFFVDYSFVEYIPSGATPFAITHSTLERVRPLILEKEYSPLLIEKILKQDLNQYDIEILLTEDDYRFLKEPFFISDNRSYQLFKKIAQNSPPLHSFKKFIEHSIASFRTSPLFIEISLTQKTPYKTLFQTPRIDIEQDIDFIGLEKFLEKIIQENTTLTIQFSLQDADPLLYTDIEKVFHFIERFKNISFIIEVLGFHLDRFKERIVELDNLTIIIYISAVSENLYKVIHSHDGLKEIEDLADFLLQKKPKKTYLQWVRMLDNEDELPRFIERWNAYTDYVIISQYNFFNTQLPSRKVVDFAPLKRFPCFRLSKDMFISTSGKIYACSLDIDNHMGSSYSIKDCSFNNLYVWLGNIIQNHFLGEYPEICKNCDYWYIANV